MSTLHRRRGRLRARDAVTSPVVTVRPEASVKTIVSTMLVHHISGVPVVAAEGELVGIVTAGDLLHRE